MSTLADHVRYAIEREALLPRGTRVLAAVSGGADSVAMLHLLRALATDCGFAIAGVVHVNHGLRGTESDADEGFCRDLAARLELQFEAGRADVAAIARAGHVSIEVAARRARYAIFREAAAKLQADRIATGHTRDDQAETLLLRLLRGAGASGLGGIHPRRGEIVRPLLDVRRSDLVSFLQQIGEPYREDSSNSDETIPRNWIRHRLLPMLAGHLNESITDVLAREALVLRDESSFLDGLAAEASRAIELAPHEGAVVLDATALRNLPAAVGRRVVRSALLRVNGGRFVGFDHVERVLAMTQPEGNLSGSGSLNPDARASADLPGARVELIAATVVLSSRALRSMPEPVSFRYQLQVPGRLAIPECGCEIETNQTAVHAAHHVEDGWVTGGDEAVIDGRLAAGGLFVRSRIPGDALRPLGLNGRKKVQDILVDRKVPRTERDRVPIVVDGSNRILWVGGLTLAEDARVTDSTQTVVVFKLTRQGES